MTTTRFVKGLGWTLCLIGAAMIVAGRVVHLVFRPELTEPQALLELSPFWGSGLVFVFFGALTIRKADEA